MKKLVVLLMVVLAAFGITGCGKDVTLTNEQNDLIAEYIAGTMLKYSYENEWKYAKLSIAQNTYVPKATAAAKPDNSTSTAAPNTTAAAGGSTVAGVSTNPMEALASELGLSNVSITVKGVSVGASYPAEQLAIAVPALSGCKVAAVEFAIKNTSGSEIKLNTSSSKVNMKLTVAGNGFGQVTSILKNDINGLKNVSLAAGENYTAVAIFQVEESVAGQVSGSKLAINSGSTSLGTVTVQ